MTPDIDARRVIDDLRELDRRTGGQGGARRLCWGEAWRDARAHLTVLLAELGIDPELDEAGNLWASLPGSHEHGPELLLGSHLDSVPEGGWLDGALGVHAALGVLRAWAQAEEDPPCRLTLVDWADEEGARFGRSLFGSSAFAGNLDPTELRGLIDAEGNALADVLSANGVDILSAPAATSRRDSVLAYLELHIEQGPVLEAEGLAVAAVSGCVGIERHRFLFRGQAAHAGTTPMENRRDAGLAAAATALAVESIATKMGGLTTTGSIRLHPGVVTAVPGEAALDVDLRHADARDLAAMLKRSRDAARATAKARGCAFQSDPIWAIAPTQFDQGLVESARRACLEKGGRERPMISGALHDAAEVSRVAPAAMIFCSTRDGLSHSPQEDTAPRDLKAAIEAFNELAARVIGAD